MSVELSDLGEDALLAYLLGKHGQWSSLAADSIGPGDDCAMLGGGELLKVDSVVEGVHFLSETPAEKVGRKALARALSDIAAMGGVPEGALVVLAVPAQTDLAWVEGVYAGMAQLGKQFEVALLGGETVSLPQGQARQLSVFLRGRIASASAKALLRSGAKVGDVLAVTGVLGGSFASQWHLEFEPRLVEGQWLASQEGVHAAMDLSDGLAADVPRLAKASGVGAQLFLEQLPCRKGVSTTQAMEDGEDYELLCAIDADVWPQLEQAWQQEFPQLAFTAIGKIVTAQQGEQWQGGWQHFVS